MVTCEGSGKQMTQKKTKKLKPKNYFCKFWNYDIFVCTLENIIYIINVILKNDLYFEKHQISKRATKYTKYVPFSGLLEK